MIANAQNGFPSPFPSLGLSDWEKKSHPFTEQWDNNLLQWSFKKHDTNWFLISERFSSCDFKNEPYGWASILEINERNQPRRDSNLHFLFPIWLWRYFYTHNSWLSVGCYANFVTGFTAPDCRAPVLNHHNTIEARVWNISFWNCKSNNCTLMVFFSCIYLCWLSDSSTWS